MGDPISELRALAKKNEPSAYQTAIAALKHRSTNDLYFFSKHILGYKDLTRRTHGEICRILQEKEPRRKLIVCPRGSFKSSLGVVSFSVFRACQNPNVRILIDSELFGNSSNFIREIRGHLENPILCAVFGEFGGTGDWTSGRTVTIKQRSVNLKESTFTASGIGAQKTGQHFDLVIMDDMNSPSNSGTPEACEKVYAHYRYNNAILEPGGEMVVIGTRYAGSDLIQKILDNECSDEQRTNIFGEVKPRGLL